MAGEKGRGGGRPLDLCVSQVDNAVVGVSLDIYFSPQYRIIRNDAQGYQVVEAADTAMTFLY